MRNETSVKYFYILVFSDHPKSKIIMSVSFTLIYLAAVLVNSSVITVICMESHLHHPMFVFICNMSFVDMLYTTVTVPKFLYILLSGNNIVSLEECFTQFYFYFAAGSTENILLFIMAYDRYVAICLPLYYHRILSKRNCTLMTMGLWVTGWLNSLLFTFSVLNMSTCHSNTIHQFFCDAKSLTITSCTSSGSLYVVIAFIILLFVVGPVSCSFISYINIFSVILRIKTRDGRRKAFSTCSSHLSVITLYYMAAMLGLLLPSYSDVLDFMFSTFYTSITPIINPIIYSLQNSDVKMYLLRLFWQKQVNLSK